MNDLDNQILQLAGRPTGMTIPEATQFASEGAIKWSIRKMLKEGVLFRLKTGSRTVRYFAFEKHFNAARQRVVEESRLRKKKLRAPPRAALDTGDMIITERTKITICPPFMPRFQCGEAPGLIGSGLQRGRVLKEDVK